MAVPVSFYGYNREDAKVSEGFKEDWWRHGMMCGFSETDFTEGLKKISVPVLVLHGDDDQTVQFQTQLSFRSSL
jgi:non-heme chloroperoxidase